VLPCPAHPDPHPVGAADAGSAKANVALAIASTTSPAFARLLIILTYPLFDKKIGYTHRMKAHHAALSIWWMPNEFVRCASPKNSRPWKSEQPHSDQVVGYPTNWLRSCQR
jgi:hypothetical protein